MFDVVDVYVLLNTWHLWNVHRLLIISSHFVSVACDCIMYINLLIDVLVSYFLGPKKNILWPS